MRKRLPPTVIAAMKLLLKQKPERLSTQLCVIKENLGMSWLRTVLLSPPCSPSGRVTLKGRIRAEMRPASTRWELERATPRRCGSPVRTPPRLPGALTPTQDLWPFVSMVTRHNEAHWLLEIVDLGDNLPASCMYLSDSQGQARNNLPYTENREISR